MSIIIIIVDNNDDVEDEKPGEDWMYNNDVNSGIY